MTFKQLYNEAIANGVDFYDYTPTLSDHIWNGARSALSGAYVGLLAKPSTVLGGAMVYSMEKIDQLTDQPTDSAVTQYLKNSLADTVKQTQLMQETAQNSGMLSSTIFSAFDVISSFVGPGKFAKSTGGTALLAGGIQGYADYEAGLSEGLDSHTAAQKALVHGGSIALGGYMPMTMGFRFTSEMKNFVNAQTKLSKTYAYGRLALKDIMYTTGANVATGAGYRGFTHDILASNGYHEMASQYHALDTEAITVDAILGIFFGGVGKFAEIKQQRYLDAALAKNNQLHQNDAAMGVPSDIESLNMHDKAFNKAFDDMINDRPVDVSAILSDGRFIIKHDVDWQNALTQAIVKHFPDEAIYYTKNGTPIPGKIIDEIKTEITNKSKLSRRDKQDIANLNNGIIPKHLTQKVMDKTGLKASDISESFDIYQRQAEVSDIEFESMRQNATYDDQSGGDIVSQILKDNPNMHINYLDESGNEIMINAKDLIESIDRDIEKTKSDKKLYDAAVACMLGSI